MLSQKRTLTYESEAGVRILEPAVGHVHMPLGEAVPSRDPAQAELTKEPGKKHPNLTLLLPSNLQGSPWAPPHQQPEVLGAHDSIH